MKTKQLSIDAMLAAMCAVLGYLAIDVGNLKLTFESLPILLGALLFGPLDGVLVGGIGTLIYQLLRYGVSATTVLWIAPYVLCGLLVGFFAKRRAFNLTGRQMTALIIAAELMITALNTGVLYVDSVVYGYYSYVYVFGTLIPRVIICVAKAAAFSMIMPGLLRGVRRIPEHRAG